MEHLQFSMSITPYGISPHNNFPPYSLREEISTNRALTEEISEGPEGAHEWWLKLQDSRYPEYLWRIVSFFVPYVKLTEGHKVLVKLNDPEGNEKVLLLDYRTRFDSTYKKKLKRKLSKIVFKRCTHLTLTTDLNQYTNIISATGSLKKGWDMVLKCLKRELDRSHKMREQYANSEISEEEFNEYIENECPFDLM